jgi:hypothetical protein
MGSEIMRRIEKENLKKRIISEAKSRGIDEKELDLDALIDETLSYSENLNNILRQLDLMKKELSIKQIEEFEKLAENVKVNLETGEIIYSDKHEIDLLPIFRDLSEESTKEIVKQKVIISYWKDIRNMLKQKYSVCPICSQPYTYIELFKPKPSQYSGKAPNVYIYFVHQKIVNGNRQRRKCYFRPVYLYKYAVERDKNFEAPIKMKYGQQTHLIV